MSAGGHAQLELGNDHACALGRAVCAVTLRTADRAYFDQRGGDVGLLNLAAPGAAFDDLGDGTVAP